MRVLLTGASGFIGSNVLAYLSERIDCTFTCPVSFRHRGSPLNLTGAARVVYADLRGELPDLGEFDAILNLASESHVDRSIADPVAFIENNISATLQLLEYARRHPCSIFVQFSTDEVFGQAPWGCYEPSNPYSASKAAQEMCALAYRRTYDVPVVITNANNVVGPGQHPEKFVPKLVRQITAGETVKIHAVHGTPGRRFYTPVQNVADALGTIVALGPQAEPPRYSIPGAEEVDNLEMARRIGLLLGRDGFDFEFIEAESVRPGYDPSYRSQPADDRLTAAGWRPPYTLDRCLKEMLLT